jgi:NTP pyrophosphatase (non-canonical NTP hydrolase)
MNTIKKVLSYYESRQLKLPSIWEALGFATTELGEVYELLLSRQGGWVRNNPDSKPSYSPESLSEELGDVIMMLIVAGIVEGVDPLQSLADKIDRKLEQVMTQERVSKFPAKMEEISEEEYNYFQDDLNFDAERERKSR